MGQRGRQRGLALKLPNMENARPHRPAPDLLIAALFILVVPGAAILIETASLQSLLPVIGTTLVLEYTAVPLVKALGHSEAMSILYVTSIGFGSIFLIFSILDLYYLRSERVRRAADWFRKRAHRSRWTQRYGIYGLTVAVAVVGVYACTVLISFAGWPRRLSITCTMIGFVACELLVLVGFESLRGLWARSFS